MFVLVAVEASLFLSAQLGWFGFNEDKNTPLALALAAIIVPMLFMLLWIAARCGFRRRFQYSLRTLLLIVTLFALPCGWLGKRWSRCGGNGKRRQLKGREVWSIGLSRQGRFGFGRFWETIISNKFVMPKWSLTWRISSLFISFNRWFFMAATSLIPG